MDFPSDLFTFLLESSLSWLWVFFNGFSNISRVLQTPTWIKIGLKTFYAQLCWFLYFPPLTDFRSVVRMMYLHFFFMPFKLAFFFPKKYSIYMHMFLLIMIYIFRSPVPISKISSWNRFPSFFSILKWVNYLCDYRN